MFIHKHDITQENRGVHNSIQSVQTDQSDPILIGFDEISGLDWFEF